MLLDRVGSVEVNPVDVVVIHNAAACIVTEVLVTAKKITRSHLKEIQELLYGVQYKCRCTHSD